MQPPICYFHLPWTNDDLSNHIILDNMCGPMANVFDAKLKDLKVHMQPPSFENIYTFRASFTWIW